MGGQLSAGWSRVGWRLVCKQCGAAGSVGRDSERVVQRTLESAPKGSDRCAADVRDASGFDDRVERRLVARVARSGLFGVTGPPVVRSGDGGHCADVVSRWSR